jgi:hypothetical protein
VRCECQTVILASPRLQELYAVVDVFAATRVISLFGGSSFYTSLFPLVYSYTYALLHLDDADTQTMNA